MNLKILNNLSKKNKIAIIVFIPIFFIIGLLLNQNRYKFVFQTDYSVNFSYGILDQYYKKPVKGGYYAFVFKAVENDKYGKSFVKKVACVNGEMLNQIGRDFYCNEKFIGKAKEYDKNGNPTTIFEYNGVIPSGYFFALGENKDSYDSRYWGFVDQNWVIGKVYVLM